MAPLLRSLAIGARRFRLVRDGGFAQWGYLLDPPSYGALIQDGTSFLRRARLVAVGRRRLRLALDVHLVMQQPAGYSRSRRRFWLEFVEEKNAPDQSPRSVRGGRDRATLS